ncbi:outer membrane lipoprotein carrier protein LolA [Hazenella sp. IB182357]|uniref:Outer membrane lipoprotein carrier protein LolA n=1 Tax=Polycladospora coralii TaxID=2771432 RepID=A0A926N8X6_9BACL|nr:DUF4367 domain-containing protein [Polycladospora coralii]MBD1372306.1 outer membrane lipoprotein carrier protein LolA [Polycladospora coralii]MBS7531504.1 outer membrane lipoprotein carrier protein LolA [Polycladospora coralii]
MKRKVWICIMAMIILTSIVGCGMKDEKSVVEDLSERAKNMDSYMSHGQMTILTGQEPLDYDIEVWYKKPHFYRVALKNKSKDIMQILLRNDEGVYVLTPHLKKSFRFQSDWPEAQGQVYLYQTLLSSIVEDQKRIFEASDKGYQFEVAAQYSTNHNLSKQKIWLDSKLYPQKVDVLNNNNEVIVKMAFDRFEENAKFDADAFDQKRNLGVVPNEDQDVMAKVTKPVEAVTPRYIPKGAQLESEQTVESPNGQVVIMRYKGEHPFTLTQKHPQAIEASLPMLGNPIQLDHTMGVLIEAEKNKKLGWTFEGTEYELLGDLTIADLQKIANSISKEPMK